jgi:hypothetical protein
VSVTFTGSVFLASFDGDGQSLTNILFGPRDLSANECTDYITITGERDSSFVPPTHQWTGLVLLTGWEYARRPSVARSRDPTTRNRIGQYID